MNWLANLIDPLLKLLGKGLSLLAAFFVGKEIGKSDEKIKNLEEENATKDRQLDAAANAPRNDDDLIKRLREGKF